MKHRSSIRAIASAFVLALGCSSSNEEGDPPEETRPDVTDACSLTNPQGSPECDACLEMSCCLELAECTADTACNMVLTCISMCVENPDPDTCPGRCFGNGAPPERFDGVLECMIGSCELACTMRAG